MTRGITRAILPKGLWPLVLTALVSLSGCGGSGNDNAPSSAPNHTVNVSAAPAAGGTVTGGGVYSDGNSVTVTASPNTGYHFVNWTEGGTEVSTLASYTFSVTADRTLVANFSINSYSVSTSLGLNGTINPAGATVYHGGTTSFTITPANGYSIGSVSGCNGSLNGVTGTYTTGQITADCTVSASFIAGGGATTFFTIGTSSSPAAGGVASGGGSYSSASSVTLTAAPNTGYHFVNWTEGGTVVSTAASYTFTATANRTLVAKFAINSYAVSTSAGPNGTISPASTTVNHGGTTSFTITPASGYSIGSVSGCNGSLNGTLATYTTGQITANCTVTAGFVTGTAKPLHSIGVNAVPLDGGVVSGGGVYSDGTSVTVSATPNAGYHFVNWTEGGTAVSTLASYTFTATVNRTLDANFAINTYTIGISTAPVAGGVVTGGGTYNHGATVTATATPSTGYQFVNWTEGGTVVSTVPSLTFTATANRTMVANFALNTYTIGVSAAPAAGGVVTGGGTYNHGAAVTLTATPSTGYQFINWTEGGTVVSTLASYAFTATANRTLVANFALNTYTIGVSAAPTAGGVVTGGGTYNHGASVMVTATPGTGFQFVNWTDGGTVVSTLASYTFTAMANRTLVANFAINTYVIGVSAAPATGGVVTGGGTYNHGTIVIISATPNTGYHFINWTDGGTVVSTAASYSFTATTNRTLVANFAINTYVIGVSAAPAAGGVVTGGGTYNHGTAVTVTATPNAGYQFINWTENGTEVSTLASYAFTATANRTLVANFALISTVTYTGSTPVDGATGVSPIADITVTASAALDPVSINATSVSLTAEMNGSTVVPSTLSYNAATNIITINPNISLPYGLRYILTLNGVRDTIGSIVVTKIITFTVSINPAIRDITYDATGAVLAYSANTLDAVGAMTKSVNYSALGPDGMPGTADDGIGADGVWFTPDDVPEAYSAYAYDAAGNQTRSVSYTAAGADGLLGTFDDGIGLDGTWFTPDDVPEAYSAYTYDAAGNRTLSVPYTAAGADLIIGTLDDGIGLDGIWFTPDDVPSYYLTNSYDTSGNLLKSVNYLTPGFDSTWFTVDDVPNSYTTFSYNSAGKQTRFAFYGAAGADGIWFTADDVPNINETYSYNATGNMTRSISYDAGPDGFWFTPDDIPNSYYDVSYDTAGNFTQFVSFSGSGADTTWFTADDFLSTYNSFYRDAAGNLKQNASYTALGADMLPGTADDGVGTDGIWFTPDDVPDFYAAYSFDAAGNQTQSVYYFAAGADGILGTLDDGVGLDGLWFTGDDVPTWYETTNYDAAGNRTQWVDYLSAGADGAWFTADDVKTLETLFNTTF